MDYQKLIDQNPSVYDKMTNSLGQEIEFIEHPTRGDSEQVICVCHELQLAEYSTFYDLEDMMYEDKEYEPKFIDGKLYIGDFLAEDYDD